ncbi:transglycosylase domain-containing protein [Acetivibrio ethanolgignens]|nr:transglycosylase domain-containing protein [Acetivibrio ethanolgignens]
MKIIRYGWKCLAAVLRGIYLALRFFVLTVLTVVIVVAACLVYKYYPEIKVYWDDAVELVSESTAEDFVGTGKGMVYAADGTVIAELKSDQNCEYVQWDDIPQEVKDAIVAIEDRRFYSHHGVDWLSTAKAAILLVKNKGEITRGGSTITQQLARNVYLTFEQSYERKIKEMFVALQLEKKYSKNQILEFYLNNINYGNSLYGIQSASLGYYGKECKDLTLDEVVTLCAIPNNPTYYNPISNPKNTASRRNVILKEMLNNEMITDAEYEKASNTAIKVKAQTKKLYNYEASYAIDCAVREVMKSQGFNFLYSFSSDEGYSKYREVYNSTYESAKKTLIRKGYKVYTTIDLKKQKVAQKALDEVLTNFKEKKDGIYSMQGAVTVVDNNTGKVVAVVGGRTQNTGTYTLNRAFQSYRQPGSSIKPLAVYTKALELGYEPESIVEDKKIADGPSNSGGSYAGRIRLEQAVWQSKNSVAWQLFTQMGCKKSLEKLQSMHFARIVPSDYYPPAALGGLTYGSTTVEMASGYAALVNDGTWREPTCIDKITTNGGVTLITTQETEQVYTKDASRKMVQILEGVAKYGTARALKLDSSIPVMCKTGTTNEQRSAWFCGSTPSYAVAVYVGYDDNRKTSVLWGSTYPLQVWQSVQEGINKKNQPAFKAPQKKELPAEAEEDKGVTQDTVKPIIEKPKSTKTPEHKPTKTSEPTETEVPEPAETETPVETETPEPEMPEVPIEPVETEIPEPELPSVEPDTPEPDVPAESTIPEEPSENIEN